MSRIFEALQKAGGEVGEVVFPLMSEKQSAGSEPPMAAAPLGPRMRTFPIRIPADAPVLPFDGSHTRAAEQYRIIRTRIVQHPEQPRMLVISSAAACDGKTVSAINISARSDRSPEQTSLQMF